MKPPKSSPDSSSRTTSSTEEPRVKPRHLESRILFMDYDIVWQKKLVAWAKDTIQTVIEKGVESEEEFYKEVATAMKELIVSSSEEEKKKKYHVVVGNDFAIQAEAVKDSIAFFAIGDVKFLIYLSPVG